MACAPGSAPNIVSAYETQGEAVDIKKMLTVVAFAALAMVIWTTYKVYFVHDPDNFFEVDARPYMVAWMIDNCKTFQCDNAGGEGGTPVKGADEADEGWVYLLATKKEPGEIALLVPRDNPHNKHLVTLEQDANGDVQIIDTGPRPEEARLALRDVQAAQAPLSPWRKFRYALTAALLLFVVAFWLWRKMRGDTRSFRQALRGEAATTSEALVIGNRAASEAVLAHASAPPASGASQEAEALRKMDRQFQSLITAADKKPGVELGRTYIGSLLAARREADAARVFKDCLGANPAFQVSQAEEALPIAKAARAAGDGNTAVAALRGFDKRYPGHSLLPEVYIFSAKLLARDMGNAEMAKKILTHVIARYPGHHLTPDARKELAALA
jgi:hypothetical protein